MYNCLNTNENCYYQRAKSISYMYEDKSNFLHYNCRNVFIHYLSLYCNVKSTCFGGKGCHRHHPFVEEKLLPVSDSDNGEKINN